MNTVSICMRVPASIAIPLSAQHMKSSLGYMTYLLDHLLIERWQYEIRRELKPFYGEHNAMGNYK